MSSKEARDVVAAELEELCGLGGRLNSRSAHSTFAMYGDSASRMRVWNELIEEFLDDQNGVVAEGRIGIVTAGPPGGGKTSQLESSFGSLDEWRVIDPDRVKVLLIRKALDLAVIEVDAAAHDLAFGLHTLGRVGNDATVINGVFEDGRQDVVRTLDSRCGPVGSEGGNLGLNRRAADIADPYVSPTWLNLDAPSNLERLQRRRLEVCALADQPAGPEFPDRRLSSLVRDELAPVFLNLH